MLNTQKFKPTKEFLLEQNDEKRFTLKHNGYHLVVEVAYLKDNSFLYVNFDSLMRIHKYGIDSQDVPKHVVNRVVMAYNNFFKEEQQ